MSLSYPGWYTHHLTEQATGEVSHTSGHWTKFVAIATLGMAATLVACAQNPTSGGTWNNPNVTQAQAEIDTTECQRYASQQAQLQSSGGLSTGMVSGSGPSMPPVTTGSNADIASCLTGKGYRQIP